MTRDDGMDEHGIDWLYECHLVGFWVQKLVSSGRILASEVGHK
jgi:hypothetical protein